MSAYFAMRIMDGEVSYKAVIKKYPERKAEIDLILIAEGKHDLIVDVDL